MPNWCFNNVSVVTCNDTALAKNQLNKFQEECFIKDKKGNLPEDIDFDFNKIIPMPESLRITSPAHNKEEEDIYKKNVYKYGHGDWYSWSIDKWGTKWNASSTYINDIQDNYFDFSFNTAWSPPIPLLKALSEKYPLLRFDTEFEEEGVGFAGRIILCKEFNIKIDRELPNSQFYNEKEDDYEDNPEYDKINEAIQEELEQEMIMHTKDMLKEIKNS